MNQPREPFSIYDFKSTPKKVILYTALKKEKHRSIFSEPHNMEVIANLNKVIFINDSWATNINRTWYTLENVTGKIVLILGGQRSPVNYEVIYQLVIEKVEAIVSMGKYNNNVVDFFQDFKKLVTVTNMQDAVISANMLAKPGYTVLLSPGCSSFDLFNDHIDRGNQFIKAVKNLD